MDTLDFEVHPSGATPPALPTMPAPQTGASAPSRSASLARAYAGRASLPLLLALAAALTACAFLVRVVQTTDWTMDADEAVHAVEALRRYEDLRTGELLTFVQHSYFPERWQPPVQDHVRWYPIVHSWSLLPFFAVGGPSDVTARLPSILYLFGTCLVFYALARRLAPRSGRDGPAWAGAAAVLLLLSAPNLITFAPQSLIAACAVFWCYLALLGYVRFVDRPDSLRRGLLAGALLAVAILTKYDHGLLLMACLGVAELVRFRWRPLALMATPALALFAIPTAAFGFWICHPDKLHAFLDSLGHPAYGATRVIGLNFLASWFLEYTSSVVVVGLALAAWITGLRRWRDPAIRGVWLYATLSMVILVSRARFQFRYNIVEAPALLLLVAAFLPGWTRELSRRIASADVRNRVRAGIVPAVSGLILLSLLFVVDRRPEVLRGTLTSLFDGVRGLRDDSWGFGRPTEAYVGEMIAGLTGTSALIGGSVLAGAIALLGLGVWLLLPRSLAARDPAWHRPALLAALAMAVLPGSVLFWARAPDAIRWEYECSPRLAPMLELAASEIPAESTVLLGGGWDQLTNNTLRWYLLTDRPEAASSYGDLQVVGDMIGSLVLPEQPRIEYWCEVLAHGDAADLPDRLVLIEPGESFLYRTPLGPEVPRYRAILRLRPAYEPVVRRDFEELDCRMEVFARVADVPDPLPRPLDVPTTVPGNPPTFVGLDGWDVRDDAWRHLRNPWLP